MKRINRVIAIAGIGLLIGTAVRAQSVSTESMALCDRAVSILREALRDGKVWVKVHAAESLLWTGHPDGVYEAFVKELDGAGASYRIGVWRVLAQAARDDTEKRQYRQKILDAFLDVKGPDRLHAAETLGKLGYAGNEPEWARVCDKETGSFQACARWVRANSGTEEDEASLAALLDSDDADARGCAAYALRFFKTIRPATFAKLAAAAQREPEASNQRANLLSPWYLHASPEARPAIKATLVGYAEHGAKDDKREMCAALGRIPDPADIPLFTRLLDDPELDVRAGAAEALLRIEASRASSRAR